MKKRKVNPSSNVAKVLDLMKADSNISVKEIVAKTGLGTKNVYVIRNYIKKHALLGGAKPKAKSQTKQQTADDKEITNLLKENKTLTDWTVMWRRKCDGLEKELSQAKIMYLDQLAIIRYLETKLVQFMESNLKGNQS